MSYPRKDTIFLLVIFCLLALLNPALGLAQRLSEVRSFGYQLQGVDLNELKASSFDLLVIDYSRDGGQEGAFSAEEILSLRSSTSPAKIVLAYLSIGEAEDYRYYFRRRWLRRDTRGRPCRLVPSGAAPSFLDQPNPNFCNNYKVRYWLRGWKRILFGISSGLRKSYLDRIIDAGFDGVYLDIIDGYEYWLHERRPKNERRLRAALDMVRLVERLAEYARVEKGLNDFVIVPQNGSGILDELSPTKQGEYLGVIDGLGAEDTFYFGDSDDDNELNPQEFTLGLLRQFKAAGKPILAIDYLTDPLKVADFKTRACAEGFLAQVSVRALDRISSHITGGCT